MPAPKGNKLWKLRSSHGRKPIFQSADQLWEACCEYFEWVEKHPLQASELVKYQGEAKVKKVPKMRVMTMSGLLLFLDINRQTWQNYKTYGDDFLAVSTRVEEVIANQKFEGAAAELLNHSIIARDLGLAEKQEHSGPDGGPIETSDTEVATKLASIMEAVKGRTNDGDSS